MLLVVNFVLLDILTIRLQSSILNIGKDFSWAILNTFSNVKISIKITKQEKGSFYEEYYCGSLNEEKTNKQTKIQQPSEMNKLIINYKKC